MVEWKWYACCNLFIFIHIKYLKIFFDEKLSVEYALSPT